MKWPKCPKCKIPLKNLYRNLVNPETGRRTFRNAAMECRRCGRHYTRDLPRVEIPVEDISAT
jgi:uncharacterized protein with PIN domain